MVDLEHGKPLVFGKDRDKGIRLNGLNPEVVQLGKGIRRTTCCSTTNRPRAGLAYLLSRMVYPEMPECLGVFRSVERPTFDEQLRQQNAEAVQAKGAGQLEDLFTSDDMWTVEAK